MVQKTARRASASAKQLTKDARPKDVLEQIVSITGVSEELRSSVSDGIVDGADYILFHQEDSIKKKKHERARLSELRRLARTVEDLANILHGLDGPTLSVAEAVASTPVLFENTASHLERCELSARTLASSLRITINLASMPKHGPTHRPAGSVKHPALHLLVRELFRWIVEHGHGRLTLSAGVDDYTPKGTLPAVLKILRPHLPTVIPARLSYKMLRRIRALTPEAPKLASPQKIRVFPAGTKSTET